MEALQRVILNRRLQESAAQQCAPVIFGIKPSNLLIIERETAYVLKSLIDATGLKIRCLSPYTRRQVWFLFNEGALEAQLQDAGATVYGGEDAIYMSEPDGDAEERLVALGKEIAAL